MRRWRTRVVAACALWVGIASATVAVAASGHDHRYGAERSQDTTRQIVCDQAVTYRSLTALGRAASSVAVIAPTDVTRRTSIGGVPFTITRVRVQETIAGSRLAHTVLLRQTGAPGAILTGCGQLVSSGRRYLAYLTPFRLRHGGPPVFRQYSVVGGSQGLFELRHPGGSVR
jgi:hypothetical protein